MILVGTLIWNNALDAIPHMPCPFLGHKKWLEPCELETLTHGS